MQPYRIASFYKFKKLTDISDLRAVILTLCQTKNVLGSILLAEEGINGTIAGQAEDIEEILSFIQMSILGSGFECKYATADFIPFKKLKVLLKKEIVTLGFPEIDPSQKTGILVDSKMWNKLIDEPDVLVLDTRNTYEVEIGTFKNAINPETSTFRDFPKYVKENLDKTKHTKIAMFCTGGIRCEKASAYLLEQGFDTVYQLEGGILKYLKEINPEKSLWQGECFVFDERRSVSTS